MRSVNLLPFVLVPGLAFASLEEAAKGVKLGGFIDTYYAYDFNQPKDHEREFTTQPVRHNEFNINLAYIEAVLNRDKTRGRLALQYGNSVTKNYSSEPTQGATSGPNDSKIFQEAYVGTKVGERTWVDMGIFLGNIGAESWISKDNWIYTRVLASDYVPYYSAGARLEHFIDNNQSFQLQLLNGWQTISENNQGKAIGMQYKNALTPAFTFAYNNFFGDEEVVSQSSRFRAYHNFVFQWLQSDAWQYIYTFDVGHQSQQENDGVDAWFTTTFTVRHPLDQKRTVAMRAEYYADPNQANVVTSTANGFRVTSVSAGYDQKLEENTMWRTELRGFYSHDRIYPQGSAGKNRLDGFLVTSLSMWF